MLDTRMFLKMLLNPKDFLVTEEYESCNGLVLLDIYKVATDNYFYSAFNENYLTQKDAIDFVNWYSGVNFNYGVKPFTKFISHVTSMCVLSNMIVDMFSKEDINKNSSWSTLRLIPSVNVKELEHLKRICVHNNEWYKESSSKVLTGDKLKSYCIEFIPQYELTSMKSEYSSSTELALIPNEEEISNTIVKLTDIGFDVFIKDFQQVFESYSSGDKYWKIASIGYVLQQYPLVADKLKRAYVRDIMLSDTIDSSIEFCLKLVYLMLKANYYCVVFNRVDINEVSLYG